MIKYGRGCFSVKAQDRIKNSSSFKKLEVEDKNAIRALQHKVGCFEKGDYKLCTCAPDLCNAAPETVWKGAVLATSVLAAAVGSILKCI